ncbi:MAG: hypothetical protein RL346_2085 [Verrucomicrobiota bacterium]|jgi:hypothetical protein
MLRFCAIFNILAGTLGVLFCIGFSMLAIGLGGSGSFSLGNFLELVRLVGPIGIAGILYCWSGVALWRSLPDVHKKPLVLTGCAMGFCLAYCIQLIVMLNGQFGVEGRHRQAGDPFDEEIVMLVFVPIAVLLLIAIQFVYLLRKRRRVAQKDVPL